MKNSVKIIFLYAECHYAECHILLIMLNVVILSIVALYHAVACTINIL